MRLPKLSLARTIAHAPPAPDAASGSGQRAASTILSGLARLGRRAWSNARTGLRRRDMVVHGSCLLVLVSFVVFDVKSIGATLLALGMLGLLRREHDRSSERPASSMTRHAAVAADRQEASWK